MDGSTADLLAQLTRDLDSENEPARVLQRIVQVAVVEVDGTDYAGIMLLERGELKTPAATNDLVRVIDQDQHDAGEGPCMQAAMDHVEIVRADDLREDPRWPKFAERALAHGVGSMLSYQLYAREDNIGALNLYAEKARAFDDEAAHVGALLATHAAVALAATRTEANLRNALQSRDMIGQAKGILMERFKIDQAAAFELLVAVSQHTHRKLRDIADDLTSTGQLPSFG
jgi:GAF domain-containing protein